MNFLFILFWALASARPYFDLIDYKLRDGNRMRAKLIGQKYKSILEKQFNQIKAFANSQKLNNDSKTQLGMVPWE
jgi:hypothetical protein